MFLSKIKYENSMFITLQVAYMHQINMIFNTLFVVCQTQTNPFIYFLCKYFESQMTFLQVVFRFLAYNVMQRIEGKQLRRILNLPNSQNQGGILLYMLALAILNFCKLTKYFSMPASSFRKKQHDYGGSDQNLRQILIKSWLNI